MNNRKSEYPSLILCGDTIGLWVTRELGKHNVSVQVVAKEKDYQIALQSKYCKKRRFFPGPWNCQSLKRLMREIAKTNAKRTVVYPLGDADTLNLSKIKDELRDDYFIVAGCERATEILVNKHKFYQSLDRCHIDHPETHYPQGLDEARKIGKKLKYPLFIRPHDSELFQMIFGFGRKGFVVNSPRELLKYYRIATSNKIGVLFQEIIPGPAENSIQIEGYFNKESYCSNLFARQRLRIWPPDFGNTTICVSVPLSNFLPEAQKIRQLIKNIGYSGLASAEFKKDDRNGKYKLLEINARPWLHFWLAAKCGIEIIYSSYLDAIGEKIQTKSGYITGVKSLASPIEDFRASMKMIREHKMNYKSWINSYKGIGRFYNFERNDLFPASIIKSLASPSARTRKFLSSVMLSHKEESAASKITRNRSARLA